MSDEQLHKLVGAVAQAAAADELEFDSDPPGGLLAMRKTYDRISAWCLDQHKALTELIAMHRDI